MTGAYFLGQIPGGALLGRSDPEYDEDGLGLGFARDNEAAQHSRFLCTIGLVWRTNKPNSFSQTLFGG